MCVVSVYWSVHVRVHICEGTDACVLQENLEIVVEEIRETEAELAMLDPPSAMKASPLPEHRARQRRGVSAGN